MVHLTSCLRVPRSHTLYDSPYWHDSVGICGHLREVSQDKGATPGMHPVWGAALQGLAPSLYLYATLFEIMHFYVTLFGL